METRKVFDHSSTPHDVAWRLYTLRQGSRQVSDFSIEFRTSVAESGWDHGALREVFYEGFSDLIKDQLIAVDLPSAFDDLMALAIKIDHRLCARPREGSSHPTTPPSQTTSVFTSSFRSAICHPISPPSSTVRTPPPNRNPCRLVEPGCLPRSINAISPWDFACTVGNQGTSWLGVLNDQKRGFIREEGSSDEPNTSLPSRRPSHPTPGKAHLGQAEHGGVHPPQASLTPPWSHRWAFPLNHSIPHWKLTPSTEHCWAGSITRPFH